MYFSKNKPKNHNLKINNYIEIRILEKEKIKKQGHIAYLALSDLIIS